MSLGDITVELPQSDVDDFSNSRSRLSSEPGNISTHSVLACQWIAPRSAVSPSYASEEFKGLKERQYSLPAVSDVESRRIPQGSLYSDTFKALQKFEGIVLSVGEDSCMTRLTDKTSGGPDEEAEVPFEEIMPGDLPLVSPGAKFYWSIGYERKRHGQQSRSSVLRFQRLPGWTQAEVSKAQSAASILLSFLDLNNADNTTCDR